MGWLSRDSSAKPQEPIHVVMYTRAGCGLCDQAWKMLEEYSGRYTLELQAIDIDSDAELTKSYSERIPVLVIEDKERFWGRINPVLLERLFEAMKRGSNH